jgi:hypothetical protein
MASIEHGMTGAAPGDGHPPWYDQEAARMLDRIIAGHPIWRLAWRTIIGRAVIDGLCREAS